jgi:hypothetical protein
LAPYFPACPETRLKVEQLARRNQTSHVLKFIFAQIDEVSISYGNKSLRSLTVEEEEEEEIPGPNVVWQGLMTVPDCVSYTISRLFNNVPRQRDEDDLLDEVGQLIFFIVGILPDRAAILSKSHLSASWLGQLTIFSAMEQSRLRCKGISQCTRKEFALAGELLGTPVSPLFWRGSDSERILRQFSRRDDNSLTLVTYLHRCKLGNSFLCLARNPHKPFP